MIIGTRPIESVNFPLMGLTIKEESAKRPKIDPKYSEPPRSVKNSSNSGTSILKLIMKKK